MKSLKRPRLLLVLLFFSTLLMNYSYSQDSKKSKKAKKQEEIKVLIDSQNFVFKAQTAFPLGGRSRNLTYDYDLKVGKDAVVSYLPYYGRAYSAGPGTSGGLDFTTKDFEYLISETKKKDGWEIVIKPKDTDQARELLLTAFKNGTANLLVSSNNKQNISFSGYIAPNKPKK